MPNRPRTEARASGTPAWTLLSNHGHVLVCLALDPEVRMRDIAAQVGVTERAVQMIIHDLIEAGLVVATKVGRRNRYILDRSQRFRHPLEAHVEIGPFTDLVRASRTGHPGSSAQSQARSPEVGSLGRKRALRQ